MTKRKYHYEEKTRIVPGKEVEFYFWAVAGVCGIIALILGMIDHEDPIHLFPVFIMGVFGIANAGVRLETGKFRVYDDEPEQPKKNKFDIT